MRYLFVALLLCGCAKQPEPQAVGHKSRAQAAADCKAMAEKAAKTPDANNPLIYAGCMNAEGWPER